LVQAEALVAELDALLEEKEQIERDVKSRRKELGVSNPLALLMLEGSDSRADGIGGSSGSGEFGAAAAANLSFASSDSKGIFFTETDAVELQGTSTGLSAPGVAANASRTVSGSEANDCTAPTSRTTASVPSGQVGGDTTTGGGKKSFIQRNIELAADGAMGTLAMTEGERARVRALLEGGEEDDEMYGEGRGSAGDAAHTGGVNDGQGGPRSATRLNLEGGFVFDDQNAERPVTPPYHLVTPPYHWVTTCWPSY
jgi:hypothetical protein